jgi:hypothetical protein
MSVEIIGGHCPSLQQLPIGSLKNFGTNLYSDPIFRVVWSESRYYLVGANHREYDSDPVNDKQLKAAGKDINLIRETRGYRWLPLYPGHPRWILELWKSPLSFTGCTKEQWEIFYRDPVTNLLTLGPYPERGEYCQCSVNLSRDPTREEVIRGIYLIKAGWNYNFAEKKQANDEALQKIEKSKFNEFEARFKDAQQAFNNRPSSLRPGKRTADNFKLKSIRPGLSPGFSTTSR